MKLYYFGNSNANTVLIQPIDEHELSMMDIEFSYIRTMTNNADFLLVGVKVDNWNNDLSPWQAPAVFGKEDFGNGATSTLSYLTDELISTLASAFGQRDRKFFIGGYSLSGLFALWAVYQSGIFAGIAAASPSVWFPGFQNFVKEHTPQTKTIYLSLGNKEEKTRNPIMAQVGDAIRDIHSHLEESGITCTLEWNEGNHFKEPEMRTAKGFAWLLNR